MFDLPWYYCCLNPTERGVLRSTAEALLLTLFVGVPLDVWDSFWFGAPDAGQARRDAFLWIYHLEIVTIEEGDPPEEVTLVRPTVLMFWVDASVFVFTPAAACLAGCEQSKLPWE